VGDVDSMGVGTSIGASPEPESPEPEPPLSPSSATGDADVGDAVIGAIDGTPVGCGVGVVVVGWLVVGDAVIGDRVIGALDGRPVGCGVGVVVVGWLVVGDAVTGAIVSVTVGWVVGASDVATAGTFPDPDPDPDPKSSFRSVSCAKQCPHSALQLGSRPCQCEWAETQVDARL
jgi:hypothetical protein